MPPPMSGPARRVPGGSEQRRRLLAAGVVASWALPTAQSKHDVALEKLTRLHILETTLPR